MSYNCTINLVNGLRICSDQKDESQTNMNPIYNIVAIILWIILAATIVSCPCCILLVKKHWKKLMTNMRRRFNDNSEDVQTTDMMNGTNKSPVILTNILINETFDPNLADSNESWNDSLCFPTPPSRDYQLEPIYEEVTRERHSI